MQRQRLFTASEKKEGDSEASLTFKRQLDYDKGQELLRLAKEESPSPQQWFMVVSLLLNAIELGHQESGDFLIKRIITNHKLNINTDLKHILEGLRKIHTTNPVAAYVLGELYCGVLQSTKNQLLPIMPEEKSSTERQKNAIQYFEAAIALGNDKARVSLCTALASGKGCIIANTKQWVEKNKELADVGHQACAFDYASYLQSSSMPLTNKVDEYIKYLFLATRGKNLDIADKALKQICGYFKNHPEYFQSKNISLLGLLQNESSIGNPLISYCLAYSYCPKKSLPEVDSILQPSAILQELLSDIKPSYEKTKQYLSLSTIGANSQISSAAKSFTDKLKASPSCMASKNG